MEDTEYKERLARDVAAWQREGLLSEHQASTILAREGTDAVKAVRALRLGWFATAVSVIGAVTLAAGIVLLFAANWDEIPSPLRVIAIFGGTAAAYSIGWALIYRFNMQRVGSALILVAALLFEGGLFLVADIYELPLDNPAPMLALAALAIVPLAYLHGSRIMLLLGLANVTLAVIAELAEQYPDSPKAESALIVIAALGIATYATGRLHALWPRFERLADVYIFGGLLVLLGLVYVFTFDEPWSEMIDSGVKSYAAPPIVYISIGLALLFVGAQWLLRPRNTENNIEAAAEVALLALASVVATWPGWSGYAVAFNAVYFAIAGGVVTRGYLRGDERYINAGLLAIAVGLLTRYIDVFWSLLASSVFFLIGGAVLLAVAFALERMRRSLLRGVPADPAGTASPA